MAISKKSFLSTPVLLVVISLLTVLSAGLFLTSASHCPYLNPNAKVEKQCPYLERMKMQGDAKAIPQNFHSAHGRLDVAKESPYYSEAPGFLGIEIATVDARTIHSSGVVTIVPGVLVVRALPQFAAFESGFSSNDIITHFNGQRITDMVQLRRRVSNTKPGTRVAVSILRNGEAVVLYPTVGPKPHALSVAEARSRGVTRCPYMEKMKRQRLNR